MPLETAAIDQEMLDLTTPETTSDEEQTEELEAPAILEELQIEEVNIDGMCGVY